MKLASLFSRKISHSIHTRVIVYWILCLLIFSFWGYSRDTIETYVSETPLIVDLQDLNKNLQYGNDAETSDDKMEAGHDLKSVSPKIEKQKSVKKQKKTAIPAKRKLLVVDANLAGVEELVKIKGVGPVIAQRIVDYRSVNGKFQTVEDLLSVKGIGVKTLEKIKPYIVLNGR